MICFFDLQTFQITLFVFKLLSLWHWASFPQKSPSHEQQLFESLKQQLKEICFTKSSIKKAQAISNET